MLGAVDHDYLLATILEAILEGNASALIQVAADIGMRSLSFSVALQDLSALCTVCK